MLLDEVENSNTMRVSLEEEVKETEKERENWVQKEVLSYILMHVVLSGLCC